MTARAVHVVATMDNGTDEVHATVTYQYQDGGCNTRMLTGRDALEWLINNEPHYRKLTRNGIGEFSRTTMPGGYIWRWEHE